MTRIDATFARLRPKAKKHSSPMSWAAIRITRPRATSSWAFRRPAWTSSNSACPLPTRWPMARRSSSPASGRSPGPDSGKDTPDRARPAGPGPDHPVVMMGYYNPIYSRGVDRFLADARAAGVDGLIVVDLPPKRMPNSAFPAQAAGLNFIRLATPRPMTSACPRCSRTPRALSIMSRLPALPGLRCPGGRGRTRGRPHQGRDRPARDRGLRHPHARVGQKHCRDRRRLRRRLGHRGRDGAGKSVADVLAFVKGLAEGAHSA